MNTKNFIFFAMMVFFFASLLETVQCKKKKVKLRQHRNMTKEDFIRIIRRNGRQEKVTKLKGRSSFNRPRKVLPSDWEKSKYPTSNINCGDSTFIAKIGYLRFVMNSKGKACYYGFLGSKAQSCTVSMLCHGEITLAAETSPEKGCEKEYMSIGDAAFGMLSGCGHFSFGQLPRKPRKGSDLHLWFKGDASSTPCVAFCTEDYAAVHTTAGIQKPKKLPKNANFAGLDTSTECTCGKINDFGRVVGGTTAQKFEFPWLGFIVPTFHPSLKRNPFCGGALISDSHVITAAHCFVMDEIEPEDIEFVLHAHVVDKTVGEEHNDHKDVPGWNLPPATDQDEGSIRLQIKEIINHPLFDSDTYDFDIAILRLKKKANLFNKKVAPICLPTFEDTITFTKKQIMIVAGWGMPWENAPANSRILQKLDVPFEEMQTCTYYTHPTYRHICAGHKAGGKDSCSGDSGGPLITIFDQSKNQYMLTGVVSAGVGCARKDKLGLYSNVNELLSWITYHVAFDEAKWCSR